MLNTCRRRSAGRLNGLAQCGQSLLLEDGAEGEPEPEREPLRGLPEVGEAAGRSRSVTSIERVPEDFEVDEVPPSGEAEPGLRAENSAACAAADISTVSEICRLSSDKFVDSSEGSNKSMRSRSISCASCSANTAAKSAAPSPSSAGSVDTSKNSASSSSSSPSPPPSAASDASEASRSTGPPTVPNGFCGRHGPTSAGFLPFGGFPLEMRSALKNCRGSSIIILKLSPATRSIDAALESSAVSSASRESALGLATSMPEDVSGDAMACLWKLK
mmetsp:Transcript_19919/g.49450  ORF Transcript_19919/g.49450 Transcript_19919/m.49450 type:complete len:274 (+) Transcript_19919:388-1209(+)